MSIPERAIFGIAVNFPEIDLSLGIEIKYSVQTEVRVIFDVFPSTPKVDELFLSLDEAGDLPPINKKRLLEDLQEPFFMARPEGFEPPTSTSVVSRSNPTELWAHQKPPYF